MERDRVLHPLLKFKVRVMEEVFIGFVYGGFVSYMVQTPAVTVGSALVAPSLL
jgi:hypothetical protein